MKDDAPAKESKEAKVEPRAGGEGPANDDEKVAVPTLEPGTVVRAWRPPGPYTVQAKLGEGGFGAVYRVSGCDGRDYAMKLEGRGENDDLLSVLKIEVRVLNAIHAEPSLQADKVRHFCHQFGRGHHEHSNYLVMSLLGASVGELRKKRPDGRFTTATALRVAWQAVDCIEALHTVGYIHRDIKPSNYAIGSGTSAASQRLIYMLDFGMCRQHVDADGVPRMPREAVEFRGTTRYAPLACHGGTEMARKDDLESWLYMVVEMCTGRLPWHRDWFKEDLWAEKQKIRDSAQAKLHFYKESPVELPQILDYLDGLKYVDKPEYWWIREVLCKPLGHMRLRMGVAESPPLPYDWEEGHDEKAATELAANVRTFAQSKEEQEERAIAQHRSARRGGRSRRSTRRPADRAAQTPKQHKAGDAVGKKTPTQRHSKRRQ